jgi:hypothetical protein
VPVLARAFDGMEAIAQKTPTSVDPSAFGTMSPAVLTFHTGTGRAYLHADHESSP